MLDITARFAALLLTTAAFATSAQAATLSADSSTISTKATSIEKSYSQDMREERNSTSMSYASTLKMRADLRMGAGIAVGGPLGVVGMNAEFNFEDENSVIAGFGTGPGYNSIQLAWKHAYEGDYIAPYFTAGYSRWYNSSNSGDINRSSILDRVLTDDEKKTGKFGTDFLNASFGLQYNQLSGTFFGFSCFAEIVGMYEVKRAQLIPSGTFGTIYYF
ncbi:hypothetical protein [Bdellovibrio svalbardensis]|uniref:Uncharacterized protein n=1 Tax=Bdellovibrio svalbardensis TaxID=2972972 RepID=A0ABT6DIV8_9BACT|nr:hypothetical protein [Bdellovibrio svalbardensis]MDG0815028.1 hypothetical protein [Bdellovibrio svalbardensis]